MDRIGILVVSYGSRAASMVDAFARSSYDVELYIADKQKNPYNLERAKEHVVIPDLSVEKILEFTKKHAEKISFCAVGPEGPVIKGVRDVLEKETGIPVVCPTKEYALEESKVRQRLLLNECCPGANPRFRVFRKQDYKSDAEAKKDLYAWLDVLDNQVAVKPDLPGYGKGVGVWGDHFNSRDELYHHFMSIYVNDAVIVEEKVDGEESSLQCFCDGRRIEPLPDVRDYKRAFDGDLGPNTGGMGSYKDCGDFLPFMTEADRAREIETAEGILRKLNKGGEEDGLRGVAFYLAYMHSKEGPKILEINSRGGDPEYMNVMPLLKDDYVDVCFDMIDGSLKKLHLKKKATVLTYKVPPAYGGFRDRYPGKVEAGAIDTPIDLRKAYGLCKELKDTLRIYPGSMKTGDDGLYYAAGSRTVACLGIGDSIEDAREVSLEGVKAVKGGALWNRNDVASREHIVKSTAHMKKLRG